MISQLIQRSWYQPFSFVTAILLPLSLLFCFTSNIRRLLYRFDVLSRTRLSVPVIVIGNISIGGTGKTPLVIAVTQYLKAQGYRPGVVSRGYGGKSTQWPQFVDTDSSPDQVGDEAVLIANRCRCPVSVGPNRVTAAQALLDLKCNIIISDDGLQHLALERDIEIVVVDGERRYGNGWCLPAGPLRELPPRLKKADLIVSNGSTEPDEHLMELKSYAFQRVDDDLKMKSPEDFLGISAHAISGIGNNERFFKKLEEMSITITRHPYPDHYVYRAKDVTFSDDLPVLMTEKDAVKCKQYTLKDTWYLRVDALLGNRFYDKLNHLVGTFDEQG